MDTMFSQVAKDPRLHFGRKKFRKKTRLHGFFLNRTFEKKNIFTDFYIRRPVSQN